MSNSAQSWDAEGYARNAPFVPELGQPVVSLLAPCPGEVILDLGCGDGALTEVIARSGATVVGVDASPELVEAARRRGLDVRLVDGHQLVFRDEFDAVFSNAALHWMLEPAQVLRGVLLALRPGGRFVGEFGGHGNVAAIVTALVAALRNAGVDGAERLPWFFPTAAEYSALLHAAGFEVNAVELYGRPTELPTGIRGWLDTFANPFLAGLERDARRDVLDDVVHLLRPSLCDRSGQWTADYVRLRFHALKPGTGL